MRRSLRTRSKKKMYVVTPGNRRAMHIKKERIAHHTCGNCGAKLNRARLDKTKLKKLPKVQRRPERPYPGLCPSCMKAKIKQMVRP